ncbi:phage tail sheath family protein [Kribbella sp. NPDC055110]
MATQVSYPGVYIEEYAPAAPIEGVSTSIAAFIGIAARGRIGEPFQVTSLDAFTAEFGEPVNDATPYHLPLAVEGFFRNGGKTAYVVRVGTAVAAHADLQSRDAAPVTLATVRAVADGPAGEGGSVNVTDSSALGTALTAAGAGTSLEVLRGSTGITAIDATRRQVTVADASSFAAGDQVVLDDGAGTTNLMAVAGTDPDVVRFTAAVPGNTDFAGGTLTTADPAAGTTTLRLVVPPAVSLRALAPIGSVVKITDGTTTEWAVAGQVGADSISLMRPLAGTFDLTQPTEVSTAEFDLAITDTTGVTRTYAGLSTSPTHPRWWGSATSEDAYARVVVDLAQFPAADPRPVAPSSTPVAGSVADDPAQSWAKVATDITTQLALLAPIDEISLVAVPGCTDLAAQQAVVEHCESLFDRFAVLDAAKGSDLNAAKTQRQALTGTLDKGFAALYYPWIKVMDPSRKSVVLHPPSGHVVGAYAKTDATRGVHKAPANIGLAGAIGVERRLTDDEQGLINLDGVNAIRILPGRGSPVVWGARTCAGDRNWQYVNIRRLFLYLEESIQEGLRPSVFEPNDLALWQQLKRTITEFLTRTWRDGALFGATAKDAFFVRIDDVLNPPSTRKLGRLYIEIGVQPVYPAEFIVVRIGIWDGGAEVAES